MRTYEEAYRAEWAGRTRRAPSDIYIPVAIREENDMAEENPSAKYELEFEKDGTPATVKLELEFKFSDNAKDFLDIPLFVDLAARLLLDGIKA